MLPESSARALNEAHLQDLRRLYNARPGRRRWQLGAAWRAWRRPRPSFDPAPTHGCTSGAQAARFAHRSGCAHGAVREGTWAACADAR